MPIFTHKVNKQNFVAKIRDSYWLFIWAERDICICYFQCLFGDFTIYFYSPDVFNRNIAFNHGGNSKNVDGMEVVIEGHLRKKSFVPI